MRITIGAAALALAGEAAAAPVAFDLAFFDESGAAVGDGLLSFDAEKTDAIWIDADDGARCDPATSVVSCVQQAVWTPVALTVTLYGLSFSGPQTNYLEGHYQPPARGATGEIIAGEWSQFDTLYGEGWTIAAGDLGAAFAWSMASAFLPIGAFPHGVASGTALASPQIMATPLPGAGVLVITGFGVIAAAIRRRKSA